MQNIVEKKLFLELHAVDTSCDTGTTYYYKVRAASTYGNAFSDIVKKKAK